MSEMGLECIINTETLISNKMQFETLFVKNMVFYLEFNCWDSGRESREVLKYKFQCKTSIMWPFIQFTWVMVGVSIAVLIVNLSPKTILFLWGWEGKSIQYKQFYHTEQGMSLEVVSPELTQISYLKQHTLKISKKQFIFRQQCVHIAGINVLA